MKIILFTLVSLFFTISTGSPDFNDEKTVHGHLDSHPLRLPMIRPTPLPVGCQKALIELKCCSDQIHEIFLGKKLEHVTDKCCKAVKEFEISCMHPGVIVPHIVIPHLLKEHCGKVAMKPNPNPNPIGFDPVYPDDPVPMSPDYADPIVTSPPSPVRSSSGQPSPLRSSSGPPTPVRSSSGLPSPVRRAPPLVRGVPALVADPPPPPSRSGSVVVPPSTRGSVVAPPPPIKSDVTSPVIESIAPTLAPTPSPAPAPSPSDLYAWLIVK